MFYFLQKEQYLSKLYRELDFYYYFEMNNNQLNFDSQKKQF